MSDHLLPAPELEEANARRLRAGERPNVIAVFHWRAVEDRLESQKQGKLVEKNVLHLTLTPRGSNGLLKVEKIWNEMHPEQQDLYMAEYREFMTGTEVPEHGTLIRDWPTGDAVIRSTCERLQIRTVEELANADRGTIQMIGRDGDTWVQRAREWASTEGELDRLKDENASQAEMLAQMRRELDELRAAQQAGNSGPAPESGAPEPVPEPAPEETFLQRVVTAYRSIDADLAPDADERTTDGRVECAVLSMELGENVPATVRDQAHNIVKAA